MPMPPEQCRIALKEWAVVCRALATECRRCCCVKAGSPSPDGVFRCEHEEFWLYPTRFHQGAESLTPAGAALLGGVTFPIEPGLVPISLFARVQSVQRITDPGQLTPYFDRQILTPQVVLERFHYKRPELYAIEVTCTAAEIPFTVRETSDMAGCHSGSNCHVKERTGASHRLFEPHALKSRWRAPGRSLFCHDLVEIQ